MLIELISVGNVLKLGVTLVGALGVYIGVWKRYVKKKEDSAVQAAELKKQLEEIEEKIKGALESDKELVEHMHLEDLRYIEVSTTQKVHTEALKDLDRDFQELIKIIIEKA
jgi:hypothetical protein